MKDFRNYFLLLAGIFLGAVICILAVNYFSIKQKQPVLQTPTEQKSLTASSFSLEHPPSESLVAEVITLTGEIKWQSRIATESASIVKLEKVQQGEDLITGERGRISFRFPDVATINLSPSSDLAVVQTLKDNLVFQQRDGTVSYQKISEEIPLSVRAKHLLVDLTVGQMTITVDNETNLITVRVLKGKASVAFNNLEFVTQHQFVPEGSVLTFDDETREVVIR